MAVALHTAASRLTHSGGYPQTLAGWTATLWVRIDVDRDDFSTFIRLADTGSSVATCQTLGSGTSGPAYYGVPVVIEGNTDLGAVGRWVPLAFSRGGASGDRIRVYSRPGNTSPVVMQEATGNSGEQTATPTEIALGGRSPGDATEWLHGSLSHVRIWSAELTQAQIETEWDSPIPVHTTGLHSNWPLSSPADLVDTVGGKVLAPQSGGQLTETAGPVFPIRESPSGWSRDLRLLGTELTPPTSRLRPIA